MVLHFFVCVYVNVRVHQSLCYLSLVGKSLEFPVISGGNCLYFMSLVGKSLEFPVISGGNCLYFLSLVGKLLLFPVISGEIACISFN